MDEEMMLEGVLYPWLDQEPYREDDYDDEPWGPESSTEDMECEDADLGGEA